MISNVVITDYRWPKTLATEGGWDNDVEKKKVVYGRQLFLYGTMLVNLSYPILWMLVVAMVVAGKNRDATDESRGLLSLSFGGGVAVILEVFNKNLLEKKPEKRKNSPEIEMRLTRLEPHASC